MHMAVVVKLQIRQLIMSKFLMCIGVLLVILSCFSDDTNAWWLRRRTRRNFRYRIRVSRNGWNGHYSYHSEDFHTSSNSNSSISSGVGGGWLWGKRSISKMAAPQIPCSFSFYDANNDEVINAYEFDAKTRFINLNQVVKVFSIIDKDDNKKITRKEFSKMPSDLEKHVFENCKGQ